MSKYIKINSVQVEQNFYNFVCDEVLIGTGLDQTDFWHLASNMLIDFDKPNKLLVQDRQRVQHLLNTWNEKNRGKNFQVDDYKVFLKEIGYLKSEGPDFKITTKNIDSEIGKIAGPQLVVPVTNPRYAINAANARWGSLYDAIYGTDVLGDIANSPAYEPNRGWRVVEWVRNFLDQSVPIHNASWNEITKIVIDQNKIKLMVNDKLYTLSDISQFVGTKIDSEGVQRILFQKNDLGIIVVLDSQDKIGKIDRAGISDVLLESAISVIMDCEDSVATVDSDDKILAYRNWLGLMKGVLKEQFKKNGVDVLRTLSPDMIFNNPEGSEFQIKGRALMLVRNVGHLMTTSLVLNENNEEIGEGLIDCLITAACGLHDRLKANSLRNSNTGSIYIVKPKMHGPEEVAFTVKLFSAVEKVLSLPADTLKLGIMDEERRTSINLKECIREAQSRVAFINTGFLDRTGDEIHSSMRLGPMVRKADMKKEAWINAYEKNNVQVGLRCGFQGKAQIGKGMWAMPDKMELMLQEKINHPNAGGNCAWVPSPTAATIHAIHYHMTYVSEVQLQLSENELIDFKSDLLKIPIAKDVNWSTDEIEEELLNNVQGILGYVVRWVDQGVGCSKVPDINGIDLMEDRATCRISSQHIANWLHHEIISEEDIITAFKKVAPIVDQQNKSDSLYSQMAPGFDGFAFMASLDLALKGSRQPSGYTEPLLHSYRIKKKMMNGSKR
jgi:malate synthase